MPPDAVPFSLLILAGAQMRGLLDVLQADPTIAMVYRQEAAELARLWDNTSGLLGRPRPDVSPVIFLAEPEEMFDLLDPPAQPSLALRASQDEPQLVRTPRPASARPLRPHATHQEMAARTEEVLLLLNTEGPLNTAEISRRLGWPYFQAQTVLRQEDEFRRGAGKRFAARRISARWIQGSVAPHLTTHAAAG